MYKEDESHTADLRDEVAKKIYNIIEKDGTYHKTSRELILTERVLDILQKGREGVL